MSKPRFIVIIYGFTVGVILVSTVTFANTLSNEKKKGMNQHESVPKNEVDTKDPFSNLYPPPVHNVIPVPFVGTFENPNYIYNEITGCVYQKENEVELVFIPGENPFSAGWMVINGKATELYQDKILNDRIDGEVRHHYMSYKKGNIHVMIDYYFVGEEGKGIITVTKGDKKETIHADRWCAH